MVYALCLWSILLVLSMSLPLSSGAVTWGYPADSTLGQCLAAQPMPKVLFPDRDSALAAVQAEYATAQAVCAGLPNPKPGWCSHIYYWEWNCTYKKSPIPCCTYMWCGFCPRVTDCGFSCTNCRDYGAVENGTWKKTNYWYFVCSLDGNPPPSQQQDVPVTTQADDKNSGGPCEGACNTTVDDNNKGVNP